MKTRIVAMALSGIIGSAVALPSLSIEPLDSAQAHNNQWFSMYDQLEFKRLADAYSDDAVVLAPASTRLQGREAVADYWQRVSAMNGKVSVAISSADVDGPQMIENGVWGVEMTTASGEVVRQGGNLLRVMEQVEGGGWKIKMESWN
jgi:ketosteroid isomerase-like protein